MKIILFDGVCNLCNGFVQFVIKHDARQQFSFASLQSDFAAKELPKRNLDPNVLKTVILLSDEQVYTKSDAALQILKQLKGFKWTSILQIFPKFFRNLVYDVIAANRYKWFGKKDQCMLPEPGLKSRFFD